MSPATALLASNDAIGTELSKTRVAATRPSRKSLAEMAMRAVGVGEASMRKPLTSVSSCSSA
ncbi:MAG: hypothetical protein Q8K85_17335, partial [Hyphomicrobium sp.]|nr:hypothetical protein [Hyphomicrobium sp.]